MENKIQALIDKANILVEALPYIQKFANKTFVVKYGGNAMVSEKLKNSVMEDLTILKFIGINPILVHGGGPDISQALTDLHIMSEFKSGLRVTDEKTMQVAQQVLVGKTNKEIVSLLNRKGSKAIGLCGIDGSLIKCKKHVPVIDGEEADIGYVGDVTKIDTHILDYLIKDEFIPVIAPIGVGEDGHSYNINADTVSSAVACAVGAEKLITLTDTEGLKDKDGNVVYVTNSEEINSMIADKVITGGMIPKIIGCMDAMKKGVKNVHIIDGRIPHCLLLEIFTNTGIGTMIE